MKDYSNYYDNHSPKSEIVKNPQIGETEVLHTSQIKLKNSAITRLLDELDRKKGELQVLMKTIFVAIEHNMPIHAQLYSIQQYSNQVINLTDELNERLVELKFHEDGLFLYRKAKNKEMK